MTKQTEFQAYGNAGAVYGDTPKAAAMTYFSAFPRSRKCSVVEGVTDGPFFTVAYGLSASGNRPVSFRDITKKQAATLGDAA